MRIPVFLLVLAAATCSSAQDRSAILPANFSGWHKDSSRIFSEPRATDAANAEALKEYGFRQAEQATYSRDGRQISLRVLRFGDGIGGFGAFTFYREPGMVREKLCHAAASAREHILVYCADLLIDARWDRITAMTMADLRSLIEVLPKLAGPIGQPPDLPPLVREADDVKLAIGPAAYSRFLKLPGWNELAPPTSSLDFERSAEALLAPVEGGRGILTVIRYPTPHIALQELTKLDRWSREPGDASSNIQAQVKRSGPIIATVRGQLGTDELKATLDTINYEADVTWSESTGLEKKNNIGSLVYAAIMLAIIIFGFAVIGGIFFGGFRLLLRRLFPGRFARREEVEFIRLNI